MRGRRRVVQWATGNIGIRSLRAVIEHPDMDLVGVFVYDDDKAGSDAGELAGLAANGIVATNDRQAILGLGADCVIHMPRVLELNDLCELLAAGSNVVTTCGTFHHPGTVDPTVRNRVEVACEAGGTTLHATGSSPGFITEAIPLALTSIQRRLDCLTIDEFANLSSRDSPELLFDIMGFGRPPASFDEGRAEHLRDAFGPSLRLVADALSLPVDRIEAVGEIALALDRVEIAAGTLDAGTVAGMRTTVSVVSDERPLIRFRANWYCTPELDTEWELQATGWRVNVEGDAPLDVVLNFAVPLDLMAETTPGYTAHRAVNAVPVVCDAAPGIHTSVDLPQIVAMLG